MNRSRTGWVGPLVFLVDVLVLLVALWLAWRVWLYFRPQLSSIVQVRYRDLLVFNQWMPPGLLMVAAWTFSLRQLGFYDPLRVPTAVRAAGALSRALLYVLILVVTLEFFVPQRYYSRLLVVADLSFSFIGLGLWRWALLKLQHFLPIQLPERPVAIVGLGREAREMADRLERFGRRPWRFAGFIDPVPGGGEATGVDPDRVVGTVDDLRSVVNEEDLAAVIIATRELAREAALELATRCAQLGVDVLQVPFTWGLASPRLRFAEIGDLQLIHLSELSYPTLGQTYKRVFDVVVVSVLLVLLAPVFLITAIAIKLDSPGPVLYAAPRVGTGGRAFQFLKFRSMVVDADRLKEKLRDRNETDGPLFKIRNDPRITRVGRFIRKYSIDELPQLWNVLRGDMNLVGPRPLPVKDLEGIEADPETAYWFDLRHQVPPGITGLWQVMGRSDLGFKDMVQYDIHYVQNWSPWLDLKILLLTVPAVLKGRGAA